MGQTWYLKKMKLLPKFRHLTWNSRWACRVIKSVALITDVEWCSQQRVQFMVAMAKDNSSSFKSVSDEPFFLQVFCSESFIIFLIFHHKIQALTIMYMIHQDESKTDKSYFNIDIRYIAVSRCVILWHHFNKIEKKSDYYLCTYKGLKGTN